jgi:hypothetical protein
MNLAGYLLPSRSRNVLWAARFGRAAPWSYIWQARRTSSKVTRLQSGFMKDHPF